MRSVFFLFCLIGLSFTAVRDGHSVEFDTSTGEQDIVLMSTDGEVNLGDSLSRAVEERYKLVKDEALQQKVNEMGQKIAAVCDRRDIIYHFKVIDDKDKTEPIINAFSLPGGYVYVFKDLCDKVSGDDELAGVISHEVGHIVARHGVKRMQAAYGYNILLLLASQAQTGSRGPGRAYAAISSLMLAYSRDDEIFADKLSVRYNKKAGYKPEGVVNFLNKLWEIQRKEPERPYISEKTHPYLSIRISKAKQEIYGKMDFTDYINIPSETQR